MAFVQDVDAVDREKEQEHLETVCKSYRYYGSFALSKLKGNNEYRLNLLPESQRRLLPAGLQSKTDDYNMRFQKYNDALIRNQFCLDCILRYSGQPNSQEGQRQSRAVLGVTDEQISKVSSVLKSLYRDWSIAGKVERDAAYEPIKAMVLKYLPIPQHDRIDEKASASTNCPRISVPGSGVGRLAFDLSRLGYSVQGNEYSLYMLLASDFILNNGGEFCNSSDRQLRISPFILESRNIVKNDDPVRIVSIPDIDPMSLMASSSLHPSAEFSMACGDFVSIYSNPKESGRWNCVASCFFLDACPNIVEVLQTIYTMLVPGGILVNIGPLLYHWSGPTMRPDDTSFDKYRERYDHLDERYLTSIEMSYEDVREVLINVGFTILEERFNIHCNYASDQRSMMNTMYKCVSFVARKN